MVTPTTPLLHQHKNRRRERPGARKRHALANKGGLSRELSEGVRLAHDPSLLLPFEYRPSPLRQSLDLSWSVWQAQEAGRGVEQRDTESDEREQRRLFGGEVDDDELQALGTMYDSTSKDLSQPASGAPVLADDFPPLPRPASTPPAPVLLKLRRHPAMKIDMPRLLSSYLSDDSEILRLMSLQSASALFDSCERFTPQSLPPTATQFPIPLPPPVQLSPAPATAASLAADAPDASWTIIPHPAADPDPWILLDDDS